MADAIVGVLTENVNSIIHREIGLLRGVADDMKKLHSTLTTIQAVLEDAESKKMDNKPLENWLAKLNDASFEATDLLEEWANNSSFSCFNLKQLHFRRTIAKKTKMLITRFDDIAEERSKFHLDENVVRTGLQLEESRESGSILEADVVYGRDNDKESVIRTLCNNMGSGEDLFVLPIIGMGGLGKTTLAQWVYNDHRVSSHFEKKIWVCVSDNFEKKEIMKMMLESLDMKGCDLDRLDTIERQLEEKLREKKFLLVLDDVWNEDPIKWIELKSVLKRFGAQGSSILVTTRENGVASIMGSVPSYSLKRLTEEKSWVLFKDCAFGEGKEEAADLVNIGKGIVRKCVGVPLAVKSLGRLAWSKTTVEEWKQVRDSKIWELKENGSGILPALKLSYHHLPLHLKRCFTFCSVYPKDYRMNRDSLIQLWMANGYLQSDGRMESESLGKLIFDELLHRGFFQERQIRMDAYDRIETCTCKMHDLMHELACSMTVNECSVVEVGREDAIVKCTRLMSLIFDLKTGAESSNRCLSLVKSNSSILRTLILLGKFRRYIEPAALVLENLYSLRALDMTNSYIEKLPNFIVKLKHLRYLNLSGFRGRLLPESICKPRNLKCLILRDCRYLKSLPKGTSKMRGLRHLDIVGCWRLSEMPDGMDQLTQLQTLSGEFKVGPNSGARVINGLKGMKQVRGELVIRGVEYVRTAEANLIIDTQGLSLLVLDYTPIRDRCADTDAAADAAAAAAAAAAGELQEKVLGKCLQPHPNLKELFINGYGGGILPSWMGELQNLVKIRLERCYSCEHLPALGRLPFLKFLLIRNMDSLKCIDAEFYGEGVAVGGGSAPATTTCWFPSLQQFEIAQMSALEEWWSPASSLSEEGEENHRRRTTQVFPCLKQLTILDCPKLKAIPCLPCVQNITLSNCNEMILRSIPNLPPRSLLTLEIQWFDEMTHLPEGTFINSSSSTTAALQSLRILDCNKLKSVSGEIQNLTSLTSLEISDCEDLDSLSELEGLLGKLTSLAKLIVDRCQSLKCLPVMGIQGGFNNSLTELRIVGCRTLTSVSQGLQYLTSLQELRIDDCPQLELMTRGYQEEEDGFRHLISLQTLTLKRLPKLRALPGGMLHLTMLQSLQISRCENLTSLPEWLQDLTSLQSLEIEYCHPDLYNRCERDKGKDWHIISHIPHLNIVEPRTGDIPNEPILFV